MRPSGVGEAVKSASQVVLISLARQTKRVWWRSSEKRVVYRTETLPGRQDARTLGRAGQRRCGFGGVTWTMAVAWRMGGRRWMGGGGMIG